MKAYKKRKITLASAIAVSCVSSLILSHTLLKARLKKSGDDTKILYEEDTGDSYEI